MTVRDSVWDAVLEKLAKHGELKVSDIKRVPGLQRATARRTLRNMERKGWLRRESEVSSVWKKGPKAELLLFSNNPDSKNVIGGRTESED